MTLNEFAVCWMILSVFFGIIMGIGWLWNNKVKPSLCNKFPIVFKFFMWCSFYNIWCYRTLYNNQEQINKRYTLIMSKYG